MHSMHWKGPAIVAILLVFAQAPAATAWQASSGPKTNLPAANARPAASAPRPASSMAPGAPGAGTQNPGSQPPGTDCGGAPCDYQPPRITIATPAPAPAPLSLQQRIEWAARLVLIMLGYAGIWLAFSMLKKIERQTRYAETAAQAAADSAQAALLQAQTLIRAERPWVLITVEPSRGIENGFTVTATNRGRSPAKIVNTLDKITSAIDQTHLPEAPQYDDAEPDTRLASVILLPGESTGIKTFSRDEVKGICVTEEKLRRVEKWQELILLYGKVIYKDLVSANDQPTYESSWCCWYIHGRQKSGMVMAGPPAYNRHI